MIALLVPVFALRLDESDAGNDPAGVSSRRAFDLLAQGFGQGFNGPLLLVAELHGHEPDAALAALRSAAGGTPGVVAVTQPQLSPSGAVAVMRVYPSSAPEALATTELVNRLRAKCFRRRAQHGHARARRRLHRRRGRLLARALEQAAAVLRDRDPALGAAVAAVFRSLVIPVQAALMNLLTVGAALGVGVAVFQWGWLGGLLGVQKGPIEAWVPVIMFAVVFGLSMDYEVFLVSRIREQWLRRHDASTAVADGISLTGRVITAAAAVMVCVFLSFVLGDERTLKEFGFVLAVAVLLDALVVRCMLLPAVLELLGPVTWRLPRWLDARLPHINIEGSVAEGPADGESPSVQAPSTLAPSP